MRMRHVVVLLPVAFLCACGGGTSGSSGGGTGSNDSSITTITVTPAKPGVTAGGTEQFTATAKDAAGNTISGVTFTWASSNTDVATINASGLATGITAGSTNITASAQGVTSADDALTVSNQTVATYYIPYSVAMGASRTPTGLYLVSAANPGMTPLAESTTALDTAVFTGPNDGPNTVLASSWVTLYSWTYNTATQQATDLTPAAEVYGQGGHLYQVSLTDPSAGPQQLSSGSYAGLCDVFNVQEGPVGSGAPIYVVADIDTVAGDNCATTADTQLWLVAAGTGSGTAPTTLPATASLLAVLWDPATGLVTGNVVQNSSELDLYDTNFVKQKVLLTGLSSNYQYAVGELDGNALIDEETYNSGASPETSTDTLYLVSGSSATQIASYSAASNSAYFTSTACQDQASGFSAFINGQNAGNQFVYSYPDASGNLNIYTLPENGGTPTAVYTSSGICLTSFLGASANNLVMVTTDSSDAQNYVSIALNGAPSQTPIVLASAASGTASSYVHYVIGNDAWVDEPGATDEQGSESVVDITTGNILQTFPDTSIADDVWGGFDPTQGILRSILILLNLPGNSDTTCDPVQGFLANGLQAVDASSLAVSSLSNSSFSECIPIYSDTANGTSYTDAEIFGPGPVLMGAMGTATGPYNLATILTGSSQQINLNVAPPPSGATANGAPFINLLEPTAVYFTY